ncbi:MAG: GNAT family N-acetyltransferase [Rhizomicrobium sp.]
MTTAQQLALDLDRIRIVPIPNHEALRGFHCGENSVDDWAATCWDREKSYRARTFCAIEDGAVGALGFYSLSMTGISAKGFGGGAADQFTRDGYIPFIYVDFIGVSIAHQQQKLGTLLMVAALRRCANVVRSVAIYGVALNSLNARTTAFYKKLNFGVRDRPGMQHPLMVLPVMTLLDAERIAEQQGR